MLYAMTIFRLVLVFSIYNIYMEAKVFNRIEKKYLITRQDKRELLKVIKKHLDKDSYHKSEVYNIYFDNNNYDLITNSIDWVNFKEKIRARSYAGYDRVFMELKTKINPARIGDNSGDYVDTDENIGYKRRVMITRQDFDELLRHKVTLETLAARSEETVNDRQIAREIDYLLQHFSLEPKILIIYNRESYKDGQNFRITFDQNLRYRDQDLSFIKAKHDKIYFNDDHNIIMEVKANGTIPLWFAHKLSERGLYPKQFSKIGKVYERIKSV